MEKINVFSRESALARAETLELGAPYRCEIEHALACGQGLVTLKDGTKIDTTPKARRLLGGGLTLVQTTQGFDHIRRFANQMLSVSKQQARLELCQQISNDLNTLIGTVDGEIRAHTEKEKELTTALGRSEEELVNTYNLLKTRESELGDLNAKLTKLRNQANRPTGVSVGIGRPGGKAKMQEITYTEPHIQKGINETNSAIQSLKKEQSRLKGEIFLKDKEIKGTGQELTFLRNISLSLKTVSTKYQSLKTSTAGITDNLDEESIIALLVDDFIDDVNRAQIAITSEFETIKTQKIALAKLEMEEKADGVGLPAGRIWTLDSTYKSAKAYFELAQFSGAILVIDQAKTKKWEFSKDCKVMTEYKGKDYFVYCGLSQGGWVKFDASDSWSWQGWNVQGDEEYKSSQGHCYILDFV